MENTSIPQVSSPSNGDLVTQNYAGFWVRVAATLVDGFILSVIASVLGLNYYQGSYYMMGSPLMYTNMHIAPGGMSQFPLTILYIIGFWIWKSATPGKMLVGLKIVQIDGTPLTWQKAILRYIFMIISILPLGLGLVWIAFDPKKQGWHDKLAGTYVVKEK